MAVRSAFSAFSSEKPHTGSRSYLYKGDDLDGIPELVDSINLQGEGPGEACRAMRKKFKYGNVHRQLRTLVIMKAVVENCPKFQAAFSNDSRLLDQLRSMANDHAPDQQVKKKLLAVFGSWYRQYKDDPTKKIIANLYLQCRPGHTKGPPISTDLLGVSTSPPKPSERELRKAKERDERERERLRKEEEKRKAKEREAEARKPKPKRRLFDFEKEKPLIVTTVANASQSSNNLMNALKHVNREKDSIEANSRVQECLAHAKTVRKQVVRYIQLVENEEFIGTLLDANERIIAALEMYDVFLKATEAAAEDPSDSLESKMAKASLSREPLQRQGSVGQLERLQGKQRAAVARSLRGKGAAAAHPDLKDLSFNGIDSSNMGSLPPPLRPSAPDSPGEEAHGSLSDYSDYDSSDEDTARRGPQASGSKPSSSAVASRSNQQETDSEEDDDPFADPFADKS